MFDSPVIKELTAIQEGIDILPNPTEPDFSTCRAFKKDSNSRCGLSPCKAHERSQIEDLLTEFRYMPECIDTNVFYEKIERFITLTHCRHHRSNVYESFGRWKTKRNAVASNLQPINPATNTITPNGSLESLAGISNMLSSGSITNGSNHKHETSESFISEKMNRLNICTITESENITTKIDSSYLNNGESQPEDFKRLGIVALPSKMKQQNTTRIYERMKTPLRPAQMSKGIVYIYEHNEIPGIFKVGWSTTSAEARQKQSKNCYGRDTKVLYETEGGRFAGAQQAEKIVHAILEHKRLYVYECTYCGKSHTEWYLVSRQEVCTIVKIVEMWLQLPAYVFQQEKYVLTEKGEEIWKVMCGFSISKMKKLIIEDVEPGNTVNELHNTRSTAAAQETSGSKVYPPATENKLPKIRANESDAAEMPQTSRARKGAPVRAGNDKRKTRLAEAKGSVERIHIGPRESTPDEKYEVFDEEYVEFKMVMEYLIIDRKKVSAGGIEIDRGTFEIFRDFSSEL
ncbi:hypothetical protein TARUN_4769 [Trichoderma arundinaceum]|uniref:Bacteriophage T5 Orf172 DNA-binding domain-containing protein n=1 Tax=Trichoderma arundinaceum TaxID=490622 RepID=A0A395NN64_TRIAR|nr:hypothetical protein TARUN_4769 [Trichoderma arundinaceum]